MSTRIAEQLLRTRESLKKKYKSLKGDILKSQSHWEKTYKPITQPLKELITLAKSDPSKTVIKHEFKEESDRQQFKTPHAYHRRVSLYPEDETFEHTPSKVRSDFGESLFDEPFPTQVEEATVTSEQEAYLQQFATPLPRAYIDGKISDTNNEYDDTFGVYYDPFSKKYAIGDATIDFDGADFLINGQFKYTGTPGLYELMFKKHPAGYRQKDVDEYIKIVKRTNAQYLGYNPEKGLSTSNAPKFVDIIKPRITSLHSMAQEQTAKKSITPTATSATTIGHRLRSGSVPTIKLKKTKSQTHKGGKLTMMEFTGKPVEYKHFDDFNEIIDRLKLLVASQLAGNTGHNNEIISIIEELKEGKIIR